MPPRAMSSEIYSGAIDWDKVYRAFHYPSRVAERILADLNGSADSVVFSGFAETAAFLADKLPVTFVDDSPSVTARARERYPKLGEVLTGDVTQLLALLPATNVAIACRISAYWNSTEQFQRLANSVLAFTRERILIDFFDRDLVESGHSIAFNSVDGTGKSDSVVSDRALHERPPVHRPHLHPPLGRVAEILDGVADEVAHDLLDLRPNPPEGQQLAADQLDRSLADRAREVRDHIVHHLGEAHGRGRPGLPADARQGEEVEDELFHLVGVRLDPPQIARRLLGKLRPILLEQ